MNITELSKIKKIIAISSQKEDILNEVAHIITNAHPNTLLDIARGIAREGTLPIIIANETNFPSKIDEHIIIIAKEKQNIQTGATNVTHIETATKDETQEAILGAALNPKTYLITPYNTTKKQKAFTMGRLDMIQSGEKCTIISDTPSLTFAIKDTQKLKEQGIECTLLHCHTLNPIDKHTLLSCASATKNIVCTERIAPNIAKILQENNNVPLTIVQNEEFIHAVRTSIKKII